MKMKLLIILSILAVVFLSTFASAAPQIVEVELDGDELDKKNGVNFLDIDRGQAVTLKVEVKGDPLIDLEDVVITAEILGYEHGDVESLHESSDVFRLRSNATHRERLRFNLPQRLEDDRYTLSVRLGGRSGTLATETFELDITGERHNVLIDDVIFSPAFNVQAGRALLTTVRVENFGEKDEDGVKVAIEIPELNVGDAKFIDEIDDGEEVTSEELFVRIPACAEPGSYKATITLTFNDGFDRESEDFSINVVDGGLCRKAEPAPANTGNENTESTVPAPVSPSKTIITVADQAQDVLKGSQGVVYPLTLTNTGSAAKTYTISVNAPWARFEISPSNVLVVEGGESKAAFIRVLANADANTGQNVFSVTVKSGDTTLKEILMRANIVESSNKVSGVSFKRGLEVGLVVLVVLIVILALIVGFNRIKDSGDQEPGEGQTYY